ncbi:acyl-CoA synthetase (AMP-forming)/AMP-acid ligase II [Nocardia tenerifensis]|uniref:Acyl-CoA synthetase (AMP-forming)/AMP-acid ligase II n=1 Tax=Nocardia tenerifensis TaxID=228006 RepID=A0A318JPT7_9NOCA|nr:AMP-binding protein [Nocardia tenerifensis]PXX54891.1 acyl-CoA synthetase (AMP-forming)/AMP-acid ligase II [Nocardia tenerifensis]
MWSSDTSANGLWQGLLGQSRPRTHSLMAWENEGYVRIPWAEVAQRARHMTAGLRRRGVAPGTRVASVLTNGSDVVSGVLGIWLAGGAVASLPVPSRGMGFEEYLASLGVMCEQLDPQLVVLDAGLLTTLPEWFTARYQLCSWQDLLGSGVVDECPPGDADVAYIQYSSGSTGVPKGCVLTAGAIARHIDMLLSWIGVRFGGDVVSSWLPLSHDMGMFGTLLSSWQSDNDLYLSTPERFSMSPRTWFGDIAEYGGTITAGTNTGVYLSARGFRRGARPRGAIDMRTCIIGAERIEWQTLAFATEVLGGFGLTPRMFMPAYGMAEATLAVTAARPDEPPRRMTVDAVELARGELRPVDSDHESATSIVSAGRPLHGVGVTVQGADRIGRIRIQSPSLGSGYWNSPELTDAHFRDGELLTSDLGFVVEDNLYLVGRSDDMINIAGRKVYARGVEEAIEQVEGVRRGCSTLVDRTIGDRAALTLLLELDADTTGHREIADQAASAAMSKAAVAVDECLFLARGALPKTPSGKIQRYRCRQLLEGGELDPWAVVSMSKGGW